MMDRKERDRNRNRERQREAGLCSDFLFFPHFLPSGLPDNGMTLPTFRVDLPT